MLLFPFHCVADWTSAGAWQWTTARGVRSTGVTQIAVAAT